MKATKQKEIILSTVHTMRNHPTADEVYRTLRENYPRLSLGTVYRNLNAFAKNGDILKVTVPGGGDRYDFKTDQHEHMLCENCGQVFDVEAKVNIVINGTQVVINGYTLLLNGFCPKCSINK